MMSREAISKGEAIFFIVILFIGLLFSLAMLSDSERVTKEEVKTNIAKFEKAKDFPFKIECNQYNMAYYIVPLMADGMYYGVVPVPVMGVDGKCIMCGTFEVNNKTKE